MVRHSVLQCVAVCCNGLISLKETCNGKAFSVAVCCSVLQCAAVCCRGLISLKETCNIQCCSVLQCVGVCWSVLQRAHLLKETYNGKAFSVALFCSVLR